MSVCWIFAAIIMANCTHVLAHSASSYVCTSSVIIAKSGQTTSPHQTSLLHLKLLSSFSVTSERHSLISLVTTLFVSNFMPVLHLPMKYMQSGATSFILSWIIGKRCSWPVTDGGCPLCNVPSSNKNTFFTFKIYAQYILVGSQSLYTFSVLLGSKILTI